MTRPSASLATLVLALLAARSRADDLTPTFLLTGPGERASSPSDLAPPRAGEYTVWAWSTKGTWTLAADAKVLTPTAKEVDRGQKPSWQSLGRITLDGTSPPTFRVAPASNGETPAPPFLAISSDPRADLSHALDLVRGDLRSIDPVADPRRTTSRTRNEGANFKVPPSRQAWLDRAEHVRTQLRVALGLWPMWPKTEMHPRVFGKLDRDGYTIEKVVLETLPGFTLSGNLYRPKGKSGRLPLMLCPHGHWTDGRMQPDVQARCIWWAKRLGCVVFLYDMVGYNDSKPFGHAFLNDRLRRWGLSLPSLQTWNSIRALDWAVTLPDVDPARVGITGESGGGTQTFLLTALDPRIKACAPVVMVSHKMQGGCVCENCAGLRIGTDNVEIAALAAPRPMKLVGANDWTDETMSHEYPTLLGVYTLMGGPDRLSADKFEFEHNYNQTTRNAVYAFLGKWLVGIDDPATTREGEVVTEKAADLRALDDKDWISAGLKTPAQLEAELIGVVGRSIDRLAPTTVASWWEAEGASLRKALEVRVGLSEPSALDLKTDDVRKLARGDASVVHSTVTWIPRGDRVPVVRLTPKAPSGQATVVFSGRGKAGLVEADGSPSTLVKALLERGQSVIGFDPLFVGESLDPGSPVTHRPTVEHFDCYNPTLAADRAQDLVTVLAWVRSRPDLREIHLVATPDAGPLALLARPMLSGLGRTAIDLGGFDYGDGSGAVPPGLDLPGVLQFGGLKAAAALSAPAPLRLTGVPQAFTREWPIKAYGLADAAGMLRIEEGRVDARSLAAWLDSGE